MVGSATAPPTEAVLPALAVGPTTRPPWVTAARSRLRLLPQPPNPAIEGHSHHPAVIPTVVLMPGPKAARKVLTNGSSGDAACTVSDLRFGLDPGCSIALPDGGGNPCRLGQAIKRYIDVAQRVKDTAYNHIYFQGSVCFAWCVNITKQGGLVYGSVSAFSVNRFWQSMKDVEESGPGRVKPSMFFGASVGISSATPQEALHNNLNANACYADTFGGCVGVTAHTASSGFTDKYPYAGFVVGDGWQIQSGMNYSIELENTRP
jgi:hypothetical protein